MPEIASEIEIEIDGQKLNVKPGQMLIKAADDAGRSIGRAASLFERL